MDQKMKFFLGGCGFLMICLYFVDPYTSRNDSKVWGILVQMSWKHQQSFYWFDGLGWNLGPVAPTFAWDETLSYLIPVNEGRVDIGETYG